jgi:hypothetical protein
MAIETPSGQPAEHRGATGARQKRLMALGVVALMLAGVAAGYRLGHGSSTHVLTGQLHSSGYQADVSVGGWTYNVPFDVETWSYENSNVLHEGDVPPCVRRPGNRQVAFGWVWASDQGSSWRQVVWVACPP